MAHTNLDYLVNGSASVIGGMTTVYSTASLYNRCWLEYVYINYTLCLEWRK